MYKFIFVFVTFCGSSVLLIPVQAWPADLAPLFAVLSWPACDRLIPGYQSENGANYAAWQREHQSDIEMAESLPEVQNKPEEIVSKLDSLSADERRKIEKNCHGLADLFQTAAPADSRFSSPDRVWALYQRSLQTADRKTVLLCLAGNEKISHFEFFKSASDQQLREVANSVAGFKIDPTTGDTAEGSLVKQDGNSFPINFGKVGKNWKIFNMTKKTY
jgi:hypothetical protein